MSKSTHPRFLHAIANNKRGERIRAQCFHPLAQVGFHLIIVSEMFSFEVPLQWSFTETKIERCLVWAELRMNRPVFVSLRGCYREHSGIRTSFILLPQLLVLRTTVNTHCSCTEGCSPDKTNTRESQLLRWNLKGSAWLHQMYYRSEN
jgi:hypothetical protein